MIFPFSVQNIYTSFTKILSICTDTRKSLGCRRKMIGIHDMVPGRNIGVLWHSWRCEVVVVCMYTVQINNCFIFIDVIINKLGSGQHHIC